MWSRNLDNEKRGQQNSSRGHEMFSTILNKTKKEKLRNANTRLDLGVDEIKKIIFRRTD